MRLIVSLLSTSFFILTLSANAQSNLSVPNAGKIWSAAYQQRAAEYKALCFQAYNIAKLRVDQAVRHRGKKPLAVITDIDETVLDNSPEGARAAYANEDFNATKWKAWTSQAAADTIPGAPEFFKYAAAKGVTVFYITNRDEDERTSTLKNLQMYHLPNANNEHLFLRNGTSSKESRRQRVLAKYNVILLCGDNLPDFDLLYDNRPNEANRTGTTQKLKAEFGKKYIVIPNPSYGDWEGALLNFDYKLTPAQKDSVIRSKVKNPLTPRRGNN